MNKKLVFRYLSICIITFAVAFVTNSAAQAAESDPPGVETPQIPVGLDAYLMWDRWPVQRIGARAYMRSTYDRRGGNETADASHFLYQQAENFNVSLDVEGAGVLYFVRTNHWHGSPWHYEVDGVDHIVQETTTANPLKKLDHSVFIPEDLFPNPLAWTYSITKGADLMWVPIAFERRFRLAYSRTFYGTGYYIYHHYQKGANLSRPVRTWDRKPPDPRVLDLLRSAGTDIAPKPGSPEGKRLGLRETAGGLDLRGRRTVELASIQNAPATIRALKLSVPRESAIDFGRARIRITWDGREAPSVDAPVALFFGAGTLYNREDKEYLVKALPVSIRFDDTRVHLACYFPMPYFKSAKIELTGGGADVPGVRWSVRTQPYTDPVNHSAYFHATYADHGEPKPGHDLVFLDTRRTEGGGEWSGNFVGTSFIFSDRAVLNTLEGDPRFFFDDSRTPQAYGTGTEEWGGGGDYWGGRNMTLPLAGHPVGAPNAKEAKNAEDMIQSAYRFLLADLMPFGKRAVIRFEHGGVNQSTEHYQSVTYWYGAPAPALFLTDEFDVGDPASEKAHRYHSPGASEPYELTSRYEWGVDRVAEPTRTTVKAKAWHYADFEFQADADKLYYIWVRGKTDGGIHTDATWFQFDDSIGTKRFGKGHGGDKGFGNWRDRAEAGAWSWSSSLPQAPPKTVTFARAGKHKLRVQLRHGPHLIDRIWLSARQKALPSSAPDKSEIRAAGGRDEIVLDATDVKHVQGGFQIVPAPGASTGKALRVSGESHSGMAASTEVYPAHTETGRTTTGSSEFTLKLDKDNLGVLLRRTLDYQYPNQRAEVFVADPDVAATAGAAWQKAGVWYLAGSNTCYHSYPRKAGELGKTNPVVQTSNRRFRDDEFLIPRALTRGRPAIRVRVVFTPANIPLLPNRPLAEQAWSEIRYQAYCYAMPDFRVP